MTVYVDLQFLFDYLVIAIEYIKKIYPIFQKII